MSIQNGSSLVRKCTFRFQGVILKKGDEKEVPVPKKGIAQPCQRGVNVDHEQSLGNCVCDGIDIYILMAHNIKIFFFYMKYLMINIDVLQVMKLL